MSNELSALTSSAQASMAPGTSDDLVRKQLIHAAAIEALDECGMLDVLTMQGGSCIAGCYGGMRLSEDLDFEQDELPTPDQSRKIAQTIEKTIRRMFGSEVRVKEPTLRKLINPSGTVPVAKWVTSVEVCEERPDIPRARVNLEIAKVPHMTSVVRRYANAASRAIGLRDAIVCAEDIEELIADKVVSLLAQEKVLRVRDVWDIAFLLRVRPVNRETIRTYVGKKAEAYGLNLRHLAERIPEVEKQDWSKLLRDGLVPMMLSEEAAEDVSSPRRATALTNEAFEVVHAALDLPLSVLG